MVGRLKALYSSLAVLITASVVTPVCASAEGNGPDKTHMDFSLPINGEIGRLAMAPQEPVPLTTIYREIKLDNEKPVVEMKDTVAATVVTDVPELGNLVDTDEKVTPEATGPVVIDNDLEFEEIVAGENYQWEEIPDEPGKTRISAGARFPVVVSTAHNSKSARKGDPVEAKLKIDLRIGGKVVARKGDVVVGRVTRVDPARRILHAELSKERWMRANGSIGIQFDEVVNTDGEHLPLLAKPAKKSRIVKNKAAGRVLGVNHNGEIVTPLSIQLKHQAAHLAIRGAASAAGVFSMGIVPVAYGVIGAINPSFAFLHPVGQNVRHRRLKGFGMGLIAGMPGGFLVADMIIKGQESIITPGDEFLAEFHQDFTGEAATDAQLIPGATTDVHGQVMTD